MREKHCYLAGAGGRSWNDVRKKYCRAGAPAEQPNTVVVHAVALFISDFLPHRNDRRSIPYQFDRRSCPVSVVARVRTRKNSVQLVHSILLRAPRLVVEVGVMAGSEPKRIRRTCKVARSTRA